MAGFFATLFKPDQMADGTRRAALETVMVAREGLDEASDKLTATIREMLRENDRANQRQRRDAPRK